VGASPTWAASPDLPALGLASLALGGGVAESEPKSASAAVSGTLLDGAAADRSPALVLRGGRSSPSGGGEPFASSAGGAGLTPLPISLLKLGSIGSSSAIGADGWADATAGRSLVVAAMSSSTVATAGESTGALSSVMGRLRRGLFGWAAGIDPSASVIGKLAAGGEIFRRSGVDSVSG